MQKIPHESHDSIDNNFQKIAQLFPSVVQEIKDEKGNIVKSLDIDELKKFFDNQFLENPVEKYQLNWPGKRKSLIRANTRITDTLRPNREESVDFDNTKNLYIEGDNFAVLKTLQHAYMGKVKMIYIDPPYNTGKDFIYTDNFTQSRADYEAENYTEDGVKMEANTETNGRFHSDWLSMMYERLLVARDLLTDDGVIFMSIDENEYLNLGKLCNEVFGEENFIENFIWTKNSTKNLSKTTSTNHEYILCYAKSKNVVEEKNFFRIKKPGFDQVIALLRTFEQEDLSVEEAEARLKNFYKKNPDLKGISMYDRVEKKFFAPKASGTGPTYDVIHPKTGKPCKTPSSGWRFTRQKMEELLKQDLIYFYEDETKVPRYKRYLNNVETEVVKSTFNDFFDGKKELVKIFDFNPFENPKPTTVLKNFIKLTKGDDIILDFFSGSATTADTVMQLNAEDGGNRQFIMVQLPELAEKTSEAYKAGYKNICEIGKERIRRAALKIRTDFAEQIAIRETPLDTGFRVYTLDSTNRADTEVHPFDTVQSSLDDYISTFKEGRSAEDILTEIMLRYGLELNAHIERVFVGENILYNLDYGFAVAYLDDAISDAIVEKIILLSPRTVILKDSAFVSDEQRINLETKIHHTLGKDVVITVF